MTDKQRDIVRNQPACPACKARPFGHPSGSKARAIENADDCDECLELVKVHCVAFREA